MMELADFGNAVLHNVNIDDSLGRRNRISLDQKDLDRKTGVQDSMDDSYLTGGK
jgi:hypothetical protein